jgi:hypothetical protein
MHGVFESYVKIIALRHTLSGLVFFSAHKHTHGTS